MQLKIANSIVDCLSLQHYLNKEYNLNINDACLYRDWVGAVYFAQEKDKRYVFKLYRASDTNMAIQTTEIIQYLGIHAFPVVSILPTKSGALYTAVDMPEGSRIGVLFDYIEGQEPQRESDIGDIGELTGKLHSLMENYEGNLYEIGKEHYIDRSIEIMRDRYGSKPQLDELKAYGDVLWNNLLRLPHGFCHGDLHTGNLIKTKNSEIIFFDFDIASAAYSVIDVATICDSTNFFNLKDKDIERTSLAFEKFYTGYSKVKKLSDAEKSAIYDCIAIRHYELNGAVPFYRLPVEGSHWMNDEWFNAQYTWLMKWQKVNRNRLP